MKILWQQFVLPSSLVTDFIFDIIFTILKSFKVLGRIKDNKRFLQPSLNLKPRDAFNNHSIWLRFIFDMLFFSGTLQLIWITAFPWGQWNLSLAVLKSSYEREWLGCVYLLMVVSLPIVIHACSLFDHFSFKFLTFWHFCLSQNIPFLAHSSRAVPPHAGVVSLKLFFFL